MNEDLPNYEPGIGYVEQLFALMMAIALSLFFFPVLGEELLGIFRFIAEKLREARDLPQFIASEYQKSKEAERITEVSTDSETEEPESPTESAEPTEIPEREQSSAASIVDNVEVIAEAKPKAENAEHKHMVDTEVQVDYFDFETMEIRQLLPFRPKGFESARARPDFYRRSHQYYSNHWFGNFLPDHSQREIVEHAGEHAPVPKTVYELFPRAETPILPPLTPPPPPMPQSAGSNSLADEKSEHSAEPPQENLESEAQLAQQLAASDILISSAERFSKFVNDNITRAWSSEAESVDLNASIAKALQCYFDQMIQRKVPINRIAVNMKENPLFLTRRYLTAIPLSLIETNQIVHLDLSNNFITSLPNWFFESMKSLTSINLSYNYLTELPDRFVELRKLKEVDLSYNRFEYFPFSLCNLYYLTVLDISDNSLLAVPDEISRLKNSLVDLDISNNALVKLPDDFKTMRKLKFCKYGDNDLLYTTQSKVLNDFSFSAEGKRTPRRRSASLKDDAETISTTEPKSSITKSEEKSTTSTTASASSAQSASAGGAAEAQSPPTKVSNPLEEKSKVKPTKPAEVEILSTSLRSSRVLFLLELLESERKYVRYMNVFYELYFIPLRVSQSDTFRDYEFHVGEKELNIIFHPTMNQIVTFSRDLLVRLLERLSFGESNPALLEEAIIGDIYLEFSQFFTQLYASCYSILDLSTLTLKKLRSENAEFERFLQAKRRLPICDGMDLETLLALPLSRLMRHLTLLRKIFKLTPIEHADYLSLKQALKLMEQSAKIQHENVFQLNNKYKIYEVEKKLKIKKLYTPSRVLIREGTLKLAPSREVEKLKKNIKKVNTNNFKESLNPYLDKLKNISFEDVKALKFDGFDLKEIWDMRLTELPVHVYLFNDLLIFKETNLFQKLAKAFQSFDLHGTTVSPSEQQDKEIIVDIAAIASKNQNKRNLVFVCDSKQERMLWLNDFRRALTETNQQTESTDTDIEIEESTDLNEEYGPQTLAENEQNFSEESDNDIYDDPSPPPVAPATTIASTKGKQPTSTEAKKISGSKNT